MSKNIEVTEDAIKILLFFILIIYPLTASSHPGGTDSRGGHKCWKNCSDWGLEKGEYHLHDNDWKPIRLDKDGKPLINSNPGILEPQESNPSEYSKSTKTTGEQTNTDTESTKEKSIIINRHFTTNQEGGSLLLNPLLLVLLIVLLILLLAIIYKKRQK
ncbi:MAG: YHYH domain-containing protein [Nitrospiraceae bacterium]|nr:YHYH domain-containing protein [Nitrospiraceae bacterium]